MKSISLRRVELMEGQGYVKAFSFSVKGSAKVYISGFWYRIKGVSKIQVINWLER